MTRIMLILKSMLVTLAIRLISLCNSHFVALDFFDSALNIDLDMSGGI